MANNFHIQTIWNTLKEYRDSSLIKQLYDSNSCVEVYATYRFSNDRYGIAVPFNSSVKCDVTHFSGLRELKVSILDGMSRHNRKMLSIQLSNPDNVYVFAVLCEDLIATVSKITDDSILIRTILNHLEQWRSLFERIHQHNLSENEQLGLFGELSFLKFLLENKSGKCIDMLQTWMGVEKASKDFQGKDWAVEVKSTVGVNNVVTINGENQLDNEVFSHLCLCHYVFERNNTYGETLPQMIDAVMGLLKNDRVALTKFELKLLEAGYMLEDRDKYELRHYNMKKRDLYIVDKDFPRIVQHDLKSGVHNVKYALDLDVCNSFLISETKLLQIID